jgi:hypothetical protein
VSVRSGAIGGALLLAISALAAMASGCGKDHDGKSGGRRHHRDQADLSGAPIDYDLSTTALPAWKGWSLKAPPGGRVMNDLDKDARVGIDHSDFDLVASQEPVDFTALKANLAKGAGSNTKLTITTDTPDALDWSSAGATYTSYGFVHVITVGGQRIACRAMNDSDDKDAVDLIATACKTLAKK